MAAEFAFVKIRATQVDQLVKEGRAAAGSVKEATGKLDAYLAVCQLGITVCTLALGIIGEPTVAAIIEPVLEPINLPDRTIGFISFAIGFGLVTFLTVVYGEMAPKTIAIQRSEGTSLATAPIMRFFYYLFFPATVVFNGTANISTRLLGIPPARENDDTYSEGEIRTLVTQSRQHGMLDSEEEAMIGGVFELDDKAAREIMVPRPDVVSLPADANLEHLLSVAAAGNYTRYPIFEEDEPDRIVGAIHVKDLLRIIQEEGLESETTARNLMRDVLIVPENRLIDDILEDFQEQEIQMAIVIDEWGSFEGLFTLEDIVEEIVGEIRDEFDEEEPAVREREDGSYTVDGRIPIQVVNNALDTDFQSEDFETIGGLVLGDLGRPPEVGDEVRTDGHVLQVEEIDGPRVAKVIVRHDGEPIEGEPEDSEE